MKRCRPPTLGLLLPMFDVEDDDDDDDGCENGIG